MIEATTDIKVRCQNREYRQAFGSETIKYDLASTLVEARKRAGISQEGLAHLMGLSSAYIAKLESGRANPTIGRIGTLLATLSLRTQLKLEPLIPMLPIKQKKVK